LIKAYKALKQHNIAVDLTVDHQVAHSVYMSDPDGNSVEYYCDTVKDWRKVLHGPMDLITGAWDPETAPGFTDGRYDEDPEQRVVASAPVHPKRLTHAVLETTNVDRLAEFYTRVGGLREAGRYENGNVRLLAAAHPAYPFNLAICKGDKCGYHHAAFEVASETALDDGERALTARGIAPVQKVDLPWKRSFFLRDPDGLLSEYYVTRHGIRSGAAGALAPAYAI